MVRVPGIRTSRYQSPSRLRKAFDLQFSADFFNAFNHPVDIDPNETTGLQDLSQQPNPPRVIQLRGADLLVV